MAKRALILVEGHRTIGLLYVKAAQRLGVYPITLSADPGQFEYLAAEGLEVIRVETDNVQALLHECSLLRSTYEIAGITGFSGLDESIYVTVGELCRHFGLPGPDPASIERCNDKFNQRQFLKKAGLPMPAYRLAMNAEEVEYAAAEIGLPVILKPAEGSGSSGVRLCRDLAELAAHTKYLLEGGHAWRSTPRILVEEFANGSFYTVNLMGNEVVAIGAAEFGPPPHFVFRETVFPAPLTDEQHNDLVNLSLRCLKGLGLAWGPASIEFRWTKLGPVVIEVNPRLAGGASPRLVQLSCGIDLIEEHIKHVIGKEWDLRRRQSYIAAVRHLVPECDGTLEWIDGERAAGVPGVVDVKFHVTPKTLIIRRGDYTDTLGHVIAASPNRARTREILQRAVDQVNWSIKPFGTAEE
ncbi:ATP-grasp domain-containing protein [Rhizobium laguerreae]|uniref:ATP-grasp domain-containing protein n=1 Tax=Rhizobium laguerreae TaxID=1076926 RepID=UPI001C92B7D9|nr:acetyl-CoA carboxylase biotin carboxylase subunit family protein [Rhizobium laguerreae]MBY3122486.1 ATP-grasp domain-containing protein [Rhizobium laguerreae]